MCPLHTNTRTNALSPWLALPRENWWLMAWERPWTFIHTTQLGRDPRIRGQEERNEGLGDRGTPKELARWDCKWPMIPWMTDGSLGAFVSSNVWLLQVGGVLWQVRGILVSLSWSSPHCSLTPTALGQNQVLETLAAETTAVSPPAPNNTTDTNRETDIQTAYSTSRSWLNLTKSVNHTSRSLKKKKKRKEMYLHKMKPFCTVTSFSGQLSTSTLKWMKLNTIINGMYKSDFCCTNYILI